MKKRIRVTAKDICEGIPGVPELCPVAKALKRAGFEEATVGPRFFKTKKGGFEFQYLTPPEVSEFLYRFDRGGSVDPFSFNIWVLKPPRNYKKTGPARLMSVDR